VIDEVVAPLFHNKEPVNDVAVNVELPQLFTTDTTGADGMSFGAAIPLPEELVQTIQRLCNRICSCCCYGDGR
jgi:hypothetical protein